MSPEKLLPPVQTNLPLFYVNSFSVSVSNADATLTLQLSGQPIANVMMSYSTLKSISQGLSKAVDALEKASGQKILTTDELQPVVAKIVGGDKK